MKTFRKIFEPGRIGNLELKNRIIYSSMDLRSTDGQGHFTPEAAYSLVERAKHGVGLVSLPDLYAWQTPGVPYGKTLSLDNDDFIPQIAGIVERIHKNGAKVMAQLGARGTRIEGGAKAGTGPSPVRFGYEKEIPRQLEIWEIEQRVEWFGDAARRCREAGVDIVEFHACTGKLVSMFLSPYSNRRTDRYGGNTRNRTRFLREILANARRKAGDDYPITVRLTVDDLLPGGIDIQEGIAIAREIAPLADAIQPSTGTQERIWNISTSYFMPRGNMLEATAAIKGACDKPIIAMSKLGEPVMAEKALEDGIADFICLGRPLLTDARWLEKTRAGDVASIRRCIGCLNCFTFNERKEIQPPRVSCTVNPELLREEEFDELRKAREPKRILVVGGGLAGMECARVLAARGHKTRLVEKGAALGGQWIVASRSAHKNEEKTLIPWLRRELEKNGVEVVLNVEATPEYIAQWQPDEVVIATGATPRTLPLPIPAPGPNVVQGNDVIMDAAETGQRVVVIGGRYVGMECAVKLARAGRHVSLVDALGIGHGTNPRILGIYRNEMVENGVYLYPDSPVLRIMDYGVDVAHLNSMLSLKADTIVLCIGTQPDRNLADSLEKAGIRHHLAGDCKRIGDALYSMRDGAELGRML